MDKDELAALDRAATQGMWGLYQHFAAPDFTRADIVGQTRDDEIVEDVNGPDAALIVALVNAYRTGKLVLIDDGAVERVAGGISTCPPMSDKHPMESLPLARAALAALGVK